VGVDISGFVEIRPWAIGSNKPWEPSILLGHLYDSRGYDAFGCLFGVINFANFRPIAGERGLPSDVSDHVRGVHAGEAGADCDSAGLWPTWIGWGEIQAVDWDEPAELADARLHKSVHDSDGQWVFSGKSAYVPEVLERDGVKVPPPPWPEGSTWTTPDVQFRAVRLTRGQAVDPQGPWGPVFEVMAVLGRLHGPANCRLVVWFDR
jgi:hypothetical protein